MMPSGDGGELAFRDAAGAGPAHGVDHRPELADRVRAAGGGVVVGGVIERFDGDGDGLLLGQVGPPELLQRAAGEHRAGSHGVVLLLLVASAGDVVGKEPADAGRPVEAGEQRNHGESLHGHGQVSADHRAEPVGLAFEAQQRSLNLFVVLEFHLEQPGDVEGDAGRAGDAQHGVLVRREDLLDVPAGDDVAHRGAPVPGHQHAAGVAERDDGGGVRHLQRRGGVRRQGRGGQVLGGVQAEGSKPGRSRWRCSVKEDVALAATWLAVVSCTDALLQRGGSTTSASPVPPRSGGRIAVLLAALLDERADELLGVGLKHAVDLIQQIVHALGGG